MTDLHMVIFNDVREVVCDTYDQALDIIGSECTETSKEFKASIWVREAIGTRWEIIDYGYFNGNPWI